MSWDLTSWKNKFKKTFFGKTSLWWSLNKERHEKGSVWAAVINKVFGMNLMIRLLYAFINKVKVHLCVRLWMAKMSLVDTCCSCRLWCFSTDLRGLYLVVQGMLTIVFLCMPYSRLWHVNVRGGVTTWRCYIGCPSRRESRGRAVFFRDAFQSSPGLGADQKIEHATFLYHFCHRYLLWNSDRASQLFNVVILKHVSVELSVVHS